MFFTETIQLDFPVKYDTEYAMYIHERTITYYAPQGREFSALTFKNSSPISAREVRIHFERKK